MTKKTKNRAERNRLRKHAAKERNRAEIKRAEQARKDWIVNQAVDHFKQLAADNPDFVRMAEQLGLNADQRAMMAAQMNSEAVTISKEAWDAINVTSAAPTVTLKEKTSDEIIADLHAAISADIQHPFQIVTPNVASGEFLDRIAEVETVQGVEYEFDDAIGFHRTTSDGELREMITEQSKLSTPMTGAMACSLIDFQTKQLANALSVQSDDLAYVIDAAMNDAHVISQELYDKWRLGQMLTPAEFEQLRVELIEFVNSQPDPEPTPEPSRIIMTGWDHA
jgi:uncharacterized protein YfiM (DUF2279 family)